MALTGGKDGGYEMNYSFLDFVLVRFGNISACAICYIYSLSKYSP